MNDYLDPPVRRGEGGLPGGEAFLLSSGSDDPRQAKILLVNFREVEIDARPGRVIVRADDDGGLFVEATDGTVMVTVR